MMHILRTTTTYTPVDSEQLEKYLFSDKHTQNQTDALKVFCRILKEHRYLILENNEPYRILTNGYHQLKWIEQKDGRLKHSAVNIFGIMQIEGLI